MTELMRSVVWVEKQPGIDIFTSAYNAKKAGKFILLFNDNGYFLGYDQIIKTHITKDMLGE